MATSSPSSSSASAAPAPALSAISPASQSSDGPPVASSPVVVQRESKAPAVDVPMVHRQDRSDAKDEIDPRRFGGGVSAEQSTKSIRDRPQRCTRAKKKTTKRTETPVSPRSEVADAIRNALAFVRIEHEAGYDAWTGPNTRSDELSAAADAHPIDDAWKSADLVRRIQQQYPASAFRDASLLAATCHALCDLQHHHDPSKRTRRPVRRSTTNKKSKTASESKSKTQVAWTRDQLDRPLHDEFPAISAVNTRTELHSFLHSEDSQKGTHILLRDTPTDTGDRAVVDELVNVEWWYGWYWFFALLVFAVLTVVCLINHILRQSGMCSSWLRTVLELPLGLPMAPLISPLDTVHNTTTTSALYTVHPLVRPYGCLASGPDSPSFATAMIWMDLLVAALAVALLARACGIDCTWNMYTARPHAFVMSLVGILFQFTMGFSSVLLLFWIVAWLAFTSPLLNHKDYPIVPRTKTMRDLALYFHKRIDQSRNRDKCLGFVTQEVALTPDPAVNAVRCGNALLSSCNLPVVTRTTTGKWWACFDTIQVMMSLTVDNEDPSPPHRHQQHSHSRCKTPVPIVTGVYTDRDKQWFSKTFGSAAVSGSDRATTTSDRRSRRRGLQILILCRNRPWLNAPTLAPSCEQTTLPTDDIKKKPALRDIKCKKKPTFYERHEDEYDHDYERYRDYWDRGSAANQARTRDTKEDKKHEKETTNAALTYEWDLVLFRDDPHLEWICEAIHRLANCHDAWIRYKSGRQTGVSAAPSHHTVDVHAKLATVVPSPSIAPLSASLSSTLSSSSSSSSSAPSLSSFSLADSAVSMVIAASAPTHSTATCLAL